jgi:hypothetical protein
VTALLIAIPFGTLLGTMFGPVRLAGVDYGKWYRNPGEINEGTDRTWIGLMKQTAVSSRRWLLALALVFLNTHGNCGFNY